VATEVLFRPGDQNKPLIIFIHAMGLDANVWVDPAAARVLGGKYPLSILLDGMELKTSFHDLHALGFPVLTWHQKGASSEAGVALRELNEILDTFSGLANGIVLIGHSRGGLFTKQLADQNRAGLKMVISIAAPYKGTRIAGWVHRISPVAAVLNAVFSVGRKQKKPSPLRRVLIYLSGSGVKEMLPGSDFVKALSSKSASGIRTISIGGTNPALVRFKGKSLPSILKKIFPEKMLPDELREGMGDGFVSAASSVYPGCCEHRNFHAHHHGLLFLPEARKYILKEITSLGEER
jgi:pimeloyl-ACP methyl ester carboxylesterase